MPVDVATFGGTPKLKSNGLNIAPPPRPNAPDTQPPMNENIINFERFFPYILISELARPVPYLILRSYSC